MAAVSCSPIARAVFVVIEVSALVVVTFVVTGLVAAVTAPAAD